MIKLITDSASDIESEYAKNHYITVIPMEVRFGTEDFYDGVTISKKEFFKRLESIEEMPKTSQINPYRFEEEFEKVVKNGDTAIVITMSSKLSGTYANAKKASEKYKSKIIVIDSLNVSTGQQLLCEYAIRLIEQRLTINEIVEKLEDKKTKINFFAMLSTLKYLKRGGRISSLVAFAGELLKIKPIIGIVDGEVKILGKAIGSKKGANMVTDLVQKAGIDFDMPFGAVYSGVSDENIKQYVTETPEIWNNIPVRDVPKYLIGATIGTHIGPNGIGVAFFNK